MYAILFDNGFFTPIAEAPAIIGIATEITIPQNGSAVSVTVTGSKEVTKVVISKDAVDPDDVEMLQDLVMAAVNEAMKQADDASSAAMGKMTGGMGLGGM